VTAQGLLLWQADRHRRSFRDADIRVRGEGFLRTARCLSVPRIVSLALPGTAADIPRRLEVQARNGGDAIDVVIGLDDCARVGVPNDRDEGMTVISECRGRAVVTGRLLGEALSFDAAAVVEFNRAA
jgi:hypothetical protein